MLTIRGVTRSFEGVPVLRGIDLNVVEGEIVCLLGASGSGKSTLLRIIAGLESADSGDVLIKGESIMNTPPHKRDFGLMFQDFALFPHMNALDNVAFGLRMDGIPKNERRERAQEMLHLVGMEAFAKREITGLSGGEKQRIALARSLAPRPRLLMLDEPLGSLDAALRDQLVNDLRRIIKSTGLTAIYVTHDQREAFAIADRIAVLHAGQVDQVAPPSELYRRPQTEYVARFLGLINIVNVSHMDQGKAHTALGVFPADGQPEKLLLHPAGIHPNENGQIDGVIQSAVFQGDFYRIELATDAGIMLDFPLYGVDPQLGDRLRVKVAPNYVVPLSG